MFTTTAIAKEDMGVLGSSLLLVVRKGDEIAVREFADGLWQMNGGKLDGLIIPQSALCFDLPSTKPANA